MPRTCRRRLDFGNPLVFSVTPLGMLATSRWFRASEGVLAVARCTVDSSMIRAVRPQIGIVAPQRFWGEPSDPSGRLS